MRLGIELNWVPYGTKFKKNSNEALLGLEPRISCLLDRCFTTKPQSRTLLS